MPLPIAPIALPSLPQLAQLPQGPATAQSAFKDVLHNAVQNVEEARGVADAAAQNFISGTSGELHSTILAAQRAEMDFELFMQARNKVVSAYEEIMKMQV